MTTKDTLGVRVLKHGLLAVTLAGMLVVSAMMIGQVVTRSVADITMHQRSVAGIAFVP
jgi:hypothetical protein